MGEHTVAAGGEGLRAEVVVNDRHEVVAVRGCKAIVHRDPTDPPDEEGAAPRPRTPTPYPVILELDPLTDDEPSSGGITVRLEGATSQGQDDEALARLKTANADLETRNRELDVLAKDILNVLDIMAIPIIVVDHDLRICRFTPTARGISNLRPQDVGRPLEEIDLRLPAAELADRIQRAIAAGRPDEYEVEGTDGRWFIVHIRPLTDDVVVAVQDFTERRLLEVSERQARLEAEQANRAKDIFLATLSHELRTPLSTILTSAELLKKAGGSDPKLKRASGAIERAVGAQARLIDELLDISRIVAGKMVLDLQPVDLRAIVKNAIDIAQPVAEAKGIGIEASLAAVRPVQGDGMRLLQVVSNLLTNALKFTPRGGRISVRLEPRDGTVELSVTDNGIGLRADLIPHLFDRFVQAPSSAMPGCGGLGLGLAIVHHIVDVHGGEVHASSPGLGHGATFTVRLPVIAKAAIAPVRRGVAAPRSIVGVRVLLVDDDEDARQAFSLMLEAQGADVRSAASAAEAIAILDTFSAQVILCDIGMPDEDGYTFIRRLRARHPIPAAALTAYAGTSDRQRALEAGFQMHLVKPIDSQHLVLAVATLASRPLARSPPSPPM